MSGTVAQRDLDPKDQRVVDRIAALLLTVPGWQRNYTATVDAAEWMLKEAYRVGWVIDILAPSS